MMIRAAVRTRARPAATRIRITACWRAESARLPSSWARSRACCSAASSSAATTRSAVGSAVSAANARSASGSRSPAADPGGQQHHLLADRGGGDGLGGQDGLLQPGGGGDRVPEHLGEGGDRLDPLQGAGVLPVRSQRPGQEPGRQPGQHRPGRPAGHGGDDRRRDEGRGDAGHGRLLPDPGRQLGKARARLGRGGAAQPGDDEDHAEPGQGAEDPGGRGAHAACHGPGR